MKIPNAFIRFSFLIMVVLITLLAVSTAIAQEGSQYDLAWGTIDSGSQTTTDSGYSLSITTGQPDSSTDMTGDGYSLLGGFWVGAESSQSQNHAVYLPVVLKKQ